MGLREVTVNEFQYSMLQHCTTSHKQGRPLGEASEALAPGADKAVTNWPHVNTQHSSMVISSFANETSRKGMFLTVLALAYSDVFWCSHMYIHVMLYVYCCKYCWLPP
jgi:hypothetical protein